MGCIIFVLTQHDPFIKCVKQVKSCQPASLTSQGVVEELWYDY